MSRHFTVPVRLCLRALPLLEMTDRERRLLSFILAQGSRGIWTCYQGNNVGCVLTLHMDWDSTAARRAVTALKKRGWLSEHKAIDNNNRPVLAVTPEFWRLCNQALERQKVRSALGWKLCIAYKIDDDRTDKIMDTAANLPEPKRYADRVKKVAQTLYGSQPPYWLRPVKRPLRVARGDTKSAKQ